jgi:hypothetical protein
VDPTPSNLNDPFVVVAVDGIGVTAGLDVDFNFFNLDHLLTIGDLNSGDSIRWVDFAYLRLGKKAKNFME